MLVGTESPHYDDTLLSATRYKGGVRKWCMRHDHVR